MRQDLGFRDSEGFRDLGSEVYSSEVKKTAVLMEHFRRAIGAPLTCSASSHGIKVQLACLGAYAHDPGDAHHVRLGKAV